ncbi:MAG: cysteine desulfurase [Methylobacterium sp.]|uniref:cysteine desulfurase family protein n=1 Tax=Methylobacterium sp. TaxID=409 RepID=UPI0025F26C63|nr:cysteine desulfurase family protein [Methylobacterium sp.]MBX9931186.1 cysteine desulfurase [Methylobacterium sp.]
MSSPRAYLDHNASSPVHPDVAAAMARALSLHGNPSSIHAEGRAARAALEEARAAVAALVAATPENVVFTSGGTEAANAALSGALVRRGGARPTRLLLGATEHPCVMAGHRFAPDCVTVIPVDAAGVLRLDVLAEALVQTCGEDVLVSVQAANNETGVVQPLPEIVALSRRHGRALVHSDAVQAIGKIPVDMGALGLDALTLSGHKFAGPKGTGAIVLAEGVGFDAPLLRGGGQERRQRGGTENLPGLVGLGAAAGLAAERVRAGIDAGLRDPVEAHLRAIAPDVVVFGEGAPRLPNTLHFAVPGLAAETALIAFDLAGIAVSSGSACASGKVARSPVLAAMGVSPALAAGAIRVSFGWNSGESDATRFLATCERLVATLYHRRGQAA